MQTSDPRICCANLGSAYFAAQASDPHAIIWDRATKSWPSADFIVRIYNDLFIYCLASLSAELECVHDCAIDRALLP